MPLQITPRELPALDRARAATDALLQRMRELSRDLPPEVSIIANGSLARRELTSQSDFDAYILSKTNKGVTDGIEILRTVQRESGLHAASDGGAFGQAHLQESLLDNIGGQQDDNSKFTRRMLFILESIPIGGATFYESTVELLVNRYVSDDITHHQIGRFLLNDIVRFYRTMCVDFEFKTKEQKKAWGTRNIKLVFSRKLMYFSGVVMCAELAERNAKAKRRILTDLIPLSPIDRLLRVLGEEIMPAMAHYDKFLGAIDDPSIRRGLENVELMRGTHTTEFRELKDSGHHFSWALVNALGRFYPSSHPIHDALIV